MAAGLDLSCRCGAVSLHLEQAGPANGTRLTCYCADCQTAARLHADGADMLDTAGGTALWQTTPDLLCITKGAVHLEILRLSPRGLMRWHASCCGTPVLNTLPKAGLPFAGVVLRQSQLAEADAQLGPSRCAAFTQSAIPNAGAPKANKGFAMAGAQILKRMIASALSGRAKANPLRAPDGGPIAPVALVSREARAAARPPHLP